MIVLNVVKYNILNMPSKNSRSSLQKQAPAKAKHQKQKTEKVPEHSATQLLKRRYSSVLLSSQCKGGRLEVEDSNQTIPLKRSKCNMVPGILQNIEKNCQALRSIYNAEKKSTQKDLMRSGVESKMSNSHGTSDRVQKDHSNRNIFEIYKNYKLSFERKFGRQRMSVNENHNDLNCKINCTNTNTTNHTKNHICSNNVISDHHVQKQMESKKCGASNKREKIGNKSSKNGKISKNVIGKGQSIKNVKKQTKIKQKQVTKQKKYIKKYICIENPSRPVSRKKKNSISKKKVENNFNFPQIQENVLLMQRDPPFRIGQEDSLADCSISRIDCEYIEGEQNLFALQI